jgi:hypothetical protein
MDDELFDEPMMSETAGIRRPDLSNGVHPDKPLEIFRLLYPVFKDEVYRRREQMIQLTAFASAFLVLLLVILLTIPSSPERDARTRWLAISGVALLFGVLAYVILQHADRHRMAKQQLIGLEQSLGLYQDGWKPDGKTLFPNNWQFDWAADRSVTIYLAVLAALTTLVICAIMVRA